MSQYDASDRGHIRLAEKAAKRADRERAGYVTNIMSTTTGRAWMLELLEASHVFASSHTGNALNTAFAEGERNMGLRLLNQIMAGCPDQYVVMMRERNVKEITEDGRRSRSNSDPDPSTSPVTGTDGRPLVDPFADAG